MGEAARLADEHGRHRVNLAERSVLNRPGHSVWTAPARPGHSMI